MSAQLPEVNIASLLLWLQRAQVLPAEHHPIAIPSASAEGAGAPEEWLKGETSIKNKATPTTGVPGGEQRSRLRIKGLGSCSALDILELSHSSSISIPVVPYPSLRKSFLITAN